jgi:deazaflavin-dependent oxidoreductase (nitroreductase family)
LADQQSESARHVSASLVSAFEGTSRRLEQGNHRWPAHGRRPTHQYCPNGGDRSARYGDGYLVAGTGSGSRREPQWFRNLRAANQAQIQIGTTQIDVDVQVVDRVERDRLWRDIILVQAPWRRRSEQQAGRTIPIAVLTPSRTPDCPND